MLGEVRTEFVKYATVLEQVKKKLEEASNKIDEASTRTRVIDKKLRNVETEPGRLVFGAGGEDD